MCTQAEGDENGIIPIEKNDKRAEEHNRFVAAFEKHGSSIQAWPAMASELGWMVEGVKVYAYSYFRALVRDRNSNTTLSTPKEMAYGTRRKRLVFPQWKRAIRQKTHRLGRPTS